MTDTQIVLVPGFWLGAWAWDEVVPLLRERGYAVEALTLPGLEPSNAERAEVTLGAQADAIVAAADQEADRRILVVHSGAAIPGTLVLDGHPELFDRVVYVDTAPAADGFAMHTDLEADSLLLEDAWDEEFAGGSMRDLSDEQLATFKERAVPQPGRTVKEPVSLVNDRRLGVPGTIICTAYSAKEYRDYAEQGMDFLAGLKEFTALEYVDLPTGHWPMWSKPQELAEAIANAAG